jgi:hypothetical protein
VTNLTDISHPCLSLSHAWAQPRTIRKGIAFARPCGFVDYGVLYMEGKKKQGNPRRQHMKENSNQARVAEDIRNHPEETYTVISRKLGIGYSTVAHIAALHDIHRPSGKRLTLNESFLGDDQIQTQ